MAVTQNTYTGNGVTTNYAFTFTYLYPQHVKASINGVVTTAFTFFNSSTLQFNTAPANGAAIIIYRDTPGDALLANYTAGSALREFDLELNLQQVLNISQETKTYAENQSTAGLQAQITAANNTANLAITTANAATVTANAADATANGIAATANTALSNSTSAVATANDALPKAGGTMTGNIVFAGSQPTATTSIPSIVQLSSSVISTSEALAATPKAVKDAYDLANGRGRITAETVQATTSGTNKDFSIPSWAKKIIVCVNDVSVNSTASILIRLGTASSFEATNYIGSSSTTTAASNGTIALSTGFDLIGTSPSADAAKVAGNVMLILCDPATNTWTCSGSLGRTDLAATIQIGGRKALAAALTRIQIVSAGTFDSGSVNVLYEG